MALVIEVIGRERNGELYVDVEIWEVQVISGEVPEAGMVEEEVDRLDV